MPCWDISCPATSPSSRPHILPAAPLLCMRRTVYPPMHNVFVCECLATRLRSTAAARGCLSVHVHVRVCEPLGVQRGRKKAMSHRTHTTRTQQLPLLSGQGNPPCLKVWAYCPGRKELPDIMARLFPTASGREQQVEAAGLLLYFPPLLFFLPFVLSKTLVSV